MTTAAHIISFSVHVKLWKRIVSEWSAVYLYHLTYVTKIFQIRTKLTAHWKQLFTWNLPGLHHRLTAGDSCYGWRAKDNEAFESTDFDRTRYILYC